MAKKTLADVPDDQLRAALMKRPDVEEMAKLLAQPVEKYVERLMFYLKNPNEEPVLTIADDEELRAAGVEVHTLDDVNAWIEKVDRGEIPIGVDAERAGYRPDEDEEVSISQKVVGANLKGGDNLRVEPTPERDKLKEDLMKQLRSQKKRQ